VTDEFPWPQTSGYRQRVANVVRALGDVGETDVFSVLSDGSDTDDHAIPPTVPVRRSVVEHVAPARRSVRGVVEWARGGRPRNIAWRSWDAARRRAFELGATAYDLVWFSHADVYAAVGDVFELTRRVVDLDNLEDEKIRQRRAAKKVDRANAPQPWTARADEAITWALDLVDERRWRALQARIARDANAVVVCSRLDRERLGQPAWIVPNGYDDVPRRATESPSGAPTVTMVSLFTYEPNLDAARFLVREILPRIRSVRPDAQVRLVGRADDRLLGLRGDGVTLTGEVPDVSPELARADVVAVPIRFGGGTRIKILEAFARGIPVVATPQGAEGIEATPGEDLLVAGDAASFAGACVRLLDEPELREQLATSARAVFEAHYRWDAIRSDLTARLRHLLERPARSSHVRG
jgi:glycosyltransferase involved in cell wall biosynthesis